VRIVLNRGVSRDGFVFYTNYNSRKAADLTANPYAAVVFHWPKASPQSSPIPRRSFLEEEFTRAQQRFGDRRIPCPPFWGGFRVVANCIEFWEGRPHRLHDRVLYRRKGKIWRIVRLAP
jgi:pyridoxamine 5'-phosphate oxidase